MITFRRLGSSFPLLHEVVSSSSSNDDASSDVNAPKGKKEKDMISAAKAEYSKWLNKLTANITKGDQPAEPHLNAKNTSKKRY